MRNPLFIAALANYGSQRDLARRIGRTEKQVSRILRGHANPTRETAERISRELNSTPARLGLRIAEELR